MDYTIKEMSQTFYVVGNQRFETMDQAQAFISRQQDKSKIDGHVELMGRMLRKHHLGWDRYYCAEMAILYAKDFADVAGYKPAQELKEYEQLFDQRHATDIRAIKMWRKLHPRSKLIMPDHVDLVMWLMKQLETLTKKLKAKRRKS